MVAPMGIPYRENMYFLPRDRYLAPIGVKICMIVQLYPVRGFVHFWC